VPSGRALATALCRHAGKGAGAQRILEAGPGTGAVTARIIEHMRGDDELWMVELNPTFAAHLRSAFAERPAFRAVADRCHLVEGALQELENDGQFDLVVSSLPLNNFSTDNVRSIFEAYARLLKPAGILSFYQYILIRPAMAAVSIGPERNRLKGERDRRSARRAGSSGEWVWLNVPPA
jgi:phospholipid N-methyltransferase